VTTPVTPSSRGSVAAGKPDSRGGREIPPSGMPPTCLPGGGSGTAQGLPARQVTSGFRLCLRGGVSTYVDMFSWMTLHTDVQEADSDQRDFHVTFTCLAIYDDDMTITQVPQGAALSPGST
jgi:hypothetical protein